MNRREFVAGLGVAVSLPLAARAQQGVVLSGFQKLADFSGTVAFMGSEGLPLPLIAAIVAVLVECVGGILLIVGYQTRLTGIILALWCIATAIVAHRNFGNQDQMIHFLKNVAIAGGFLQLAAFGAGGWSLDARRSTVALHRCRH